MAVIATIFRSMMPVKKLQPLPEQIEWYCARKAEECDIIKWGLEALERTPYETLSASAVGRFGSFRKPCMRLDGQILGWLRFWAPGDGYYVFYYERNYSHGEAR